MAGVANLTQNHFSLFSVAFLQDDLLFPGLEENWKMNEFGSRAPHGGSRGGWGDINACAVCVLKCKCPLLWVPKYARNYEAASEF